MHITVCTKQDMAPVAKARCKTVGQMCSAHVEHSLAHNIVHVRMHTQVAMCCDSCMDAALGLSR